MGSVSTQSPTCSRGERLSALVDGELADGLPLDRVLAECGAAERASWAEYHVIGDALRSDELTLSPAVSDTFLARFSGALAAEPHLLSPGLPPVARTMLSLRRRVVPALAVAAAAATLTWIVVPQMQGIGGHGAPVQVASVGTPAPHAGAQPLRDVNLIRDASLDQYLEAHQQFAQQPVVTGSMPYIRAAVATTQGQ